MRLNTIFDRLRYGTLKGFAVSRDGAGVEEVDYPRMIVAINAATVALYSRYKLKYNELFVRILEGKFTYELDSKYAESNQTSPEFNRWIIDTYLTPFSNDLVRIHSITGNDGCPYSINDDNDCFTIMTPTFNSIQLPSSLVDCLGVISVVYEATPDHIPVNSSTAPEFIEVAIPYSMLEALCYYAASVFIESSTNQDKSAKAQEYLAKYELACSKLEEYGSVNVDSTSNINVGINQWP